MKCHHVAVCGGVLLAGSVSFGQSPPRNDDFTNRIVLTGSSITITGTLDYATWEPGEPVFGSTGDNPSVWWSWTPSENTVLTIEVLDPVLSGHGSVELLDGPELGSLNRMDYTPMETPGGSLAIRRFLSYPATVSTSAGSEYIIRVSGTLPGGFRLRLTATNDPIILEQPQDCSIPQYGSALFSVAAAGLPPLCYYWRCNGTNVTGDCVICSDTVTKPVLMLYSATTNQANEYSVVVSNSTGTTTSRLANLVVSLTNAHPVLAALPPSSPTKQDFALTGEPGRWYWVQTSTDLSR